MHTGLCPGSRCRNPGSPRGAAYNQTVTERVAATLARYNMLPPGGPQRLGVAVSGGGDSVYLLYALRELGLASAILHINHGLRGAESDRDETFVRALAQHFDLPCYVFVAPVIQGNTEQEARRLRYQFFAEHIAAGHCDAVATGHTLDDQAETVFYRFLRGSGTAGLSGIRPVHTEGTSVVIRPLLELRRDEIRAWLAAHKVKWLEDSSNANHEFVRNRIRNRYLPELIAGTNPALPELLASTAVWAQGEEDYWEAELDRLAPSFLVARGESILMETAPFLALVPAVQRRLLRGALGKVRGSLRGIGFAHVEAARALLASSEGSGRIQLPGLDIYRSFDWLRISPLGFDAKLPRDFEFPLPVPGRLEIPERRLTMEMELVSAGRVYNGGMNGALDRDLCTGSLTLRNWRPGDHFHRQGHSSPEKIKTLFQEFRIPLWDRRNWPVVECAGPNAGAIVWTRRFGVDARFIATPETCNTLTIRELVESNPLDPTSIQMKRASGAGSWQGDTPGTSGDPVVETL